MLLQPARLVTFGFGVAVTIGSVLLALPMSWAGPGRASLLTALFTSASAVCVTGLGVVDTGTAWSGFGKGVIVALVQVGGIGIMTLASLISLIVADRLGLRARTLTMTETGKVAPGEVRRTLRGVFRFSLAIEAILVVILTLRFFVRYDEPFSDAVGSGVFYSVMSFNNAGFGLAPDSLVRYVGDWWINIPVMVAIVAGGIGFPVLNELVQRRRPRSWSLHARLTIATSAVLVVVGTAAIAWFEWTNPATIGALDGPEKLLASAFQSVSARTAGFNTFDMGNLREATILILILLMFIGSGVASTGGGIKVTTMAVLVLACWAEIRGSEQITVGRRTIPHSVVRQALVATMSGVAVVMTGTFVLLLATPFLLDRVLFEVVSAFATVGLSTGITADVGTIGQLTLVVVMFLGRVGPVTLGLALVLRQRKPLYRYPEGSPLVG